jgi:hypothetical protein
MDFTLSKYSELLDALKAYDFENLTLRHDVDLKPMNSLRTAQMEAEKGMHGIYYFRAVPESWDEEAIRLTALLGHEVGYHYESLTTCNGDVDKAYDDFCRNLEALRALVPVKSICMHGSPRSPYDSKDIWKKYELAALGLSGEPYLTTDFSHLLYLTDTGRRWDGYKVSVRDKIEAFQGRWDRAGWSFHTTQQILDALEKDLLPAGLMITTHPQRWNDFGPGWVKEYILQHLKNIVKRFIVRRK